MRPTRQRKGRNHKEDEPTVWRTLSMNNTEDDGWTIPNWGWAISVYAGSPQRSHKRAAHLWQRCSKQRRTEDMQKAMQRGKQHAKKACRQEAEPHGGCWNASRLQQYIPCWVESLIKKPQTSCASLKEMLWQTCPAGTHLSNMEGRNPRSLTAPQVVTPG
jgi:hypothetical protein